MNEKEAKEIVALIEKAPTILNWSDNENLIRYCQGYLEAIEKAKVLEEALELADLFIDSVMCGQFDETNESIMATLELTFQKVAKARRQWEKEK